MSKIRITKIFRFEMAHALKNYDGPCKNIHGHSYKLYVTIIGEPIKDINSPKYGMVLDFSVLKKIVKKNIVDPLDHALMLRTDQGLKELINKVSDHDIDAKICWTDYQPTCENMLLDFKDRIINELPKEVKLFSLKLTETNTSYAEWYEQDNG